MQPVAAYFDRTVSDHQALQILPPTPHAMREPVLAHTKMSFSILQLFAGLEYFFLLNYISSCLQVVNINITTIKGQGLYQSDFLCVSIQFKTLNSESAKVNKFLEPSEYSQF